LKGSADWQGKTGAGRIVWQDIVHIDVAIKKHQFHKNEVILSSFKRAKDTNRRLHLLGLVWHYLLYTIC
jgi:2,3-bisphosphoglycerate-independent phosphoglycerate mutase